MKFKNKIITFLFAFTIILGLLPTIKVQAATTDVDIISNSKVTAREAKKWAKSKGATETFIDLADLYFKYSEECGDVNPSLAYVQAAKETGYGNFRGVLDESYCNPCGLKVGESGADSDKNAHQKFDTWKEGVQAHMDHLALYAGAKGYPKSNTYDSRHFITIKGKATTIKALNGKWAPSTTYGDEIYNLYKDLLIYSGVEKVETSNEISNNDKKDLIKNKGKNESNTNKITPPKSPSSPNATEVIKKVINNTPNITSSIGWKYENGSWCYYKSDNTKAVGWIKPDSNWYYLEYDGNMATGWLNYNGKWYYLNSSGIMVNGWIQVNNLSYFLQGDGSMVTGCKNIEGNIYTFDNNGAMKINVTTPIATKVIVVDAGHNYGGDGGSTSTIDDTKYKEVDLNIQVASKLKKELENRGYTVVMTRKEDDKQKLNKEESLFNRVNIANKVNGKFFISIHHNSVDGIPEAKGIETYYSSSEQSDNFDGKVDPNKLQISKKMAKLINDNIANKLNLNNRGIKDSDYYIRSTNMPSILVEVGFITNPEEAKRCADSDSQQKVAEAIAEVISANF